MRLEGLSDNSGKSSEMDFTILPFELKDSGGSSGIQEKHGLFESPQPKQLFAKLKQEANLERTKSKKSCSSEKEHKVNALAPRADEGRDNLR